MGTLVIAEKNLAAKRISYLLSNGNVNIHRENDAEYYSFVRDGEEYYVVGLKGHIVQLDYPPEYSKWDDSPEVLIDIEPIKVVKIENIAKLLKKLSLKADKIVVATDYDREGELIGLEALEIINVDPNSSKVKRARFSSITKEEIEKAFKNLTSLDLNLARAAETRQKIDLLWGAVLTRFLSILANRRGKDFISAGRVQSPTLRIIVDREKEIEGFESKPFWKIELIFDSFKAVSENTFYNEDEVNKVYEMILREKEGIVKEYSEEIKNLYRPVPFNTTLFLKACSDIGISVGKAMKIAEDLYTRGYISYPRTDNTTYPAEINLRGILNKLIESEFSAEASELLSKDFIPAKGKYNTKDHPPIHPVRGARKKDLPEPHWKVYELIVRRFFATLAEDAIIEKRRVVMECSGLKFTASGKKLLNLGWIKYYPYEQFEEEFIPRVIEGEKLKIVEIKIKKDRTKPPSRFSQGSLVELMEKLELGTKSTRHEIIEKLIERGFLRAGRILKPTKLGITVAEALKQNVEEISKPDMTAKLERDMDLIAEGKILPNTVYDNSKELLRKIMKELKKNSENIRRFLIEGMRVSYGTCIKCGGTLLESKNSVECNKCGVVYKLPLSEVAPTSDKCPVCSLPIIEVKRGNRKDKRCLDQKCKYNMEKDCIGVCPKCGEKVLIKWSSNGKRFAGCSGYPNCSFALPLPQRGKIIPLGTENDCIKILVIDGKRRYNLCLKEKREN